MNPSYTQPASAPNTTAPRRQLVVALLAADTELAAIGTPEELLRLLAEALAALRVVARSRRTRPTPPAVVLFPNGSERPLDE